MPTISLRLTEEQHAELREWAFSGQRSIQREIIWRLFTIEGGQAPKHYPATEEPRVGKTVPADGSVHELRAADLSEVLRRRDDEVRTDWK